ncbi:MAG: signal peptide peptidase SppA [Flavobacteriales bacterium]|nr:signal peptide peptidase SppA [Flavobacteriales bacterium]
MHFLRNLFANLVSLIVFSVITVLVVLISLLSVGDDFEVTDNSILHIKVNGDLKDQSKGTQIFKEANCQSDYKSIEKAIQLAVKDTLIKAIYLEVGAVDGSLANIESLRRSLLEYKKSGRKIISYSTSMSQIGYHLSSVADSIYLGNMTGFEWKGIGAQLLYFKSMLSKIGVKAEPIRVGKFKSAIEPFIMDSISTENEYQVKELINDVWINLCSDIQKSRGISKKSLEFVANDLGVLTSEEALMYGFVDAIKYEDEVKKVFKKLFFGNEKYISVKQLINANSSVSLADDKLVIVNAEGSIIDMPSESDISGFQYGKIFDDILKDESVKAMVIRINSPGGSAKASEELWRKIKLIQEKVPVIISMGNVAASGGYYMATAGDRIFAENNTITGSIGVFGLMFNVSELTENIGVNVEKVKTHKMSDFPSFDRSLTSKEKTRLQLGINKVYDVFLDRVAKGRGLSIEKVEGLASGRVWTGKQAKENGLVDSIGGLNMAIETAKQAADIKTYKLVELPKILSPIEQVVKHFSNQEVRLPEPFANYNYMIQNPDFFKTFHTPQVRLPFVISIK